MRTFLFSNKESSYEKDKHAPPIKKAFKWRRPKTNSHQLETFLPLVEKDLFAVTLKKNVKGNLSEDERGELNGWRKNNFFNKDSDLVMRIQDKGNRFIVVDKETDRNKAQEQIDRSSFITLDHDPTSNHIKIVPSEWANKWFRKGKIGKYWRNYIINEDAQSGKYPTLYKTHKQGNPIRLLTTGCNTAIENLSRLIENTYALLTENIRYRDTSHLLDIIDTINEKGMLDEIILASFDTVNMFPSIDNVKGMDAVRLALNTRDSNKPSTECVLEGLEICLY